MDALTQRTTPERLPAPDEEPARYRANITEGWQQGRGAFGGVIVGLLVRAMLDAAGGTWPLRSVSAELVGPATVGDSEIAVTSMRRGSGTHTLGARLTQGDELRANAVAVMGRERAPDLGWTELEPPALRAWTDVPVIPVRAPMGPTFAQHFEYRTDGPLPFSGGERAETSGWIRPVEPAQVRDGAYLAALADAWWPAAFHRLSAPRPMSTLTFLLQLVHPADGLAPEEPLAYRARCVSAHAGHLVEVRELWSPDGRLLAINTQTFVAIQ